MPHEMQVLLADKEHFQNLLIGANEKLTCFNVTKEDLQQHRDMFNNSEHKRGELQEHLNKAATESKQIAITCQVKHDEIINDNVGLKKELEESDKKVATATEKIEAKCVAIKAEHQKREKELLAE